MRRFTREPKPPFSHDLHVLGTPPAFVLSQDQTLQLNLDRPTRPCRADRCARTSETACTTSMRFTVLPLPRKRPVAVQFSKIRAVPARICLILMERFPCQPRHRGAQEAARYGSGASPRSLVYPGTPESSRGGVPGHRPGGARPSEGFMSSGAGAPTHEKPASNTYASDSMTGRQRVGLRCGRVPADRAVDSEAPLLHLLHPGPEDLHRGAGLSRAGVFRLPAASRSSAGAELSRTARLKCPCSPRTSRGKLDACRPRSGTRSCRPLPRWRHRSDSARSSRPSHRSGRRPAR